MGRAFEYRKARKLKRWGNMARTFTKLGKEIAIAVKAAGPDPAGNTRLRVLIQNAKAANMPKENVERAIKRATSKEMGDYKEMVYEGYAPFGIAMVIRDGNRQYDPHGGQRAELFQQGRGLARHDGIGGFSVRS